jgi:hypothetical protein
MVHLRGAVVELQGKGDGQGTFRDGDLVGTRTAVGGDEGGEGRADVGGRRTETGWRNSR